MTDNQERQNEVSRLTQEGLSVEEIASELGITEEEVQVWQLTQEGLSDEEIASRLEISLERVKTIKQQPTE